MGETGTAMQARRVLWLWGWLALFGGCGEEQRVWTPADHGHPEAQAGEPLPAGAPAGGGSTDPDALGKALWVVHCARCHGRSGRGDGPGRPPGMPEIDLADPAWQAERSDAYILQVIRSGRGMMPAFGGTLSEPARQALVAYIRGF